MCGYDLKITKTTLSGGDAMWGLIVAGPILGPCVPLPVVRAVGFGVLSFEKHLLLSYEV